MEVTINKKELSLNQFSNFALGAAIVALLLSFPVTPLAGGGSASSFGTNLLFTLAGFLLIFHSWNRNYDSFATASLQTPGHQLVLFSRLILTLLSILVLRFMLVRPDAVLSHFHAFYGTAGLCFAFSAIPLFIKMGPAYGKERVMVRREYLSDVFFAAVATAVALLSYFMPDFFAGWLPLVITLVAMLLLRLLAKTMTTWREAAPPHRGGRRAPGEGRNRQRRPSGERQQGGSERRPARSRAGGNANQRGETSERRPASTRTRKRPQQDNAEAAPVRQARPARTRRPNVAEGNQARRRDAGQQPQGRSSRPKHEQADTVEVDKTPRPQTSAPMAQVQQKNVAPEDQNAASPEKRPERKSSPRTENRGRRRSGPPRPQRPAASEKTTDVAPGSQEAVSAPAIPRAPKAPASDAVKSPAPKMTKAPASQEPKTVKAEKPKVETKKQTTEGQGEKKEAARKPGVSYGRRKRPARPPVRPSDSSDS